MPEALKKLINSISYLPGIGENRATKLAFFLLNSNKNFLDRLSDNLLSIKNQIKKCDDCNGLTDIGKNLCGICLNPNRDKNIICVVEEYLDMLTIEESASYKGVYHILGGTVSPINGIFVGDLSFKDLFRKIEDSSDKLEIILATNPNIEGEATSTYIIEEIENKKLKYKTKLSRLSRGLSSGYIEYADNMTIINALKERKEI